MAGSLRKQDFVVAVLMAISSMLSGCSFGTSQDKETCDGGACDCKNSYYGMQAGMYIAGVPIEHASLHVTIPRAERDTENSTGCCSALYDLYPIREAGVNTPSKGAEDVFCKRCAKAPNAELSEATKSCPAVSAAFLFSALERRSIRFASGDPPMDGADAYSDCGIDIDGVTSSLLNGKNVTGVKTSFNIRWTDLKNSSMQTCCVAIQPLIKHLYGLSSGDATPSEREHFCSACKAAYNPGVGLAAFRLCNGASMDMKEAVAKDAVLA